MRRGGRKAKQKDYQENGGASKAQKSGRLASSAYDSDSYENHVIDLRGDGDEGDDKDGSTAEAASGSPNEHLESRRGHPHLPLSDHRSENDVTADRHIASRRSAVHPSRLSSDQGRSVTSEVVQAGEGSNQKVEFLGGEVVWAKFARFPWWPAMVQNEEDLNEDFKGDKPAEHNIAVRFFGTYDYAWVDPAVGLSRFDVKLQERSRTRKKALSKGVEEAMEFRAAGKLPKNWDCTASDSDKGSKRAEANGSKSSKIGGPQPKQQQGEEPEQRRAARTRKPKVVFEVCHAAGGKKNGAKVKERSTKQEDATDPRRPERKLRRIRIMRHLGLAAPYGSPFTLEGVLKGSL